MTDERMVSANGVDLCVETFGERTDQAVLLVGNSMLDWPDDFCVRLAGRSRYVVRYDQRDTGRSTFDDPDAPAYTLRDLVADAVCLQRELHLADTQVVGMGTGGWIAQLLTLDHPELVASLTLIGTRPTAPGPSDPDLPEHAPSIMRHFMSATEPDWSDRDSVIEAMVAGARVMAGPSGEVESGVRDRIGRIFDRAAGTDADPRKVHRSSQIASVFAALDSGERWRHRLPDITAPTVVIHGADDPFFPLGNGAALAHETPGARLVVMPGTGHHPRSHDWPAIADAILGSVR